MYYEPSSGRYLSMDPPSPNGDLLFENPFVYAKSNPVNRIEDNTTNKCKVCVHCWDVAFFDGYINTFRRHCGLTVYYPATLGGIPTSIWRIDGSGAEDGFLVLTTSPPFPKDKPNFTIVDCREYDNKICKCILDYKGDFNNAPKPCMEYNAFGCNSNWALNCIMNQCNSVIPITPEPPGMSGECKSRVWEKLWSKECGYYYDWVVVKRFCPRRRIQK